MENHLEAVAPLGIDPRTADHRLELRLGAEDARWAGELLEREGLAGRAAAALIPGASHAVNRWPAAHFAGLARRLDAELGVASILVGGAQDRELADAVLAGCAGARVVDLVGRASLLRTGAVLARCAVAVSGDTGPMHMATAVGTPVVALFGARRPAADRPGGGGAHRAAGPRSPVRPVPKPRLRARSLPGVHGPDHRGHGVRRGEARPASMIPSSSSAASRSIAS